jgi:hypothetical protein
MGGVAEHPLQRQIANAVWLDYLKGALGSNTR